MRRPDPQPGFAEAAVLAGDGWAALATGVEGAGGFAQAATATAPSIIEPASEQRILGGYTFWRAQATWPWAAAFIFHSH
jgi:hypothetical protein